MIIIPTLNGEVILPVGKFYLQKLVNAGSSYNPRCLYRVCLLHHNSNEVGNTFDITQETYDRFRKEFEEE